MKNLHTDMPAIVMGSGITALGVIRSLAQVDIPAYYLPTIRDFAGWSRWSRRLPQCIPEFPTEEELADRLEQLPFPGAVLFPCNDAVILTTANLPGELRDRFPSSLSPAETLELLADKGKFTEVLQKHQIPHPESILIKDTAHLAALDKRYFEGFFLKPCRSKEFGSLFQGKAFAVSGREDAVANFERARAAGLQMLLQEYVPGPADNHYFIDGFVDREGHVCAYFARRRLRIYPPGFGNSSYCESIPLQQVDGAVRSLDHLLKALRYRGIFSAEFKFDLRDEQFKILEINARPWWYIEFTTRCGVNTCMMAYQDARDQKVNDVTMYREGVGCIHGIHDLKAASALVRTGELSWAVFLQQWRRGIDAFFSWKDPLPAIIHWLTKTISIPKRILRRT